MARRGMADPGWDERVRSSAMAYLRTVTERTGGLVRSEEVNAFEIDGHRIPLLDLRRGIRKPAQLDTALSIRTVYSPDPLRAPYEDLLGQDSYLRYKWQGTNPDLPVNVALRLAMDHSLPMIWFRGRAPGIYEPFWPIWMVDEEPESHQFVVALDERLRDEWDQAPDDLVSGERRGYAYQFRKTRLDQPVFRDHVLRAYRSRCAMCRLRHPELLDAAHIHRDTDGGAPVVTNGIAMCKIHHAAYDSRFMAIRPDYQIEVRPDILDERDGPTLRHAVQGLHEQRILLPTRRVLRPDRDLLEERYDEFLSAT